VTEPHLAAVDVAQLALLGEAAANVKELAVLVWDDDRHYVAVNDAACKLTGLSREQLLGLRVGDLTADHAAADVEAIRHNAVYSGSSSIERSDGAVPIDWITCHTRIAGLPFMVSVCWRKGER
jgi:PAS domain-containing protein